MDKKLLLRSIGDQPISMILIGCEEPLERLAAKTGIELPPDIVTGNDVLAALETLDEPTQRRFLASVPEPRYRNGFDVGELGTVIAQLRRGQSGWKTAVAVFMALLVGVVVVDYAVMMYIATVRHISLPVHWEDITFIIIVPGGIVWAWFGVLSRENRDLLKATIGEVSIPGPVGALINMFTKRTEARQETAQRRNVDNDTYTPPSRNQTARARPVDDGDVDDNPPPGAAR